MHNLRVVTASIALFFGCVVTVAAQNSSLAVAPMHFRGLMPVIEVKLNGEGPFVFAIDTGAGMQADIDPSIATQLKLEPIGKIRTGDPSGQNDRVLEATRIASLAFGGAEFQNVIAIIRPQQITQDYPKVDGILGFALFTDCLLTLDYPAMQVRLAKGSLPVANGSDILAFEIENRIPVIEVAIGKLRMKAHIDSGNFVAGFILPEAVVEQLPLLSPPVTVGRARSITNLIEIKQVQLRDTIHIGSFDYPQATIAFPALSETNVGFKVLREFALTFDQKNQRMKFERAPGTTFGGRRRSEAATALWMNLDRE
jgi:aspartyl protease